MKAFILSLMAVLTIGTASTSFVSIKINNYLPELADTVKHKPQQPIPSKENEASKVWMEKDGMVVIEAENVAHPLPEGWEFKQEHQGYTGKGYIQWTGKGMWGPETYDYQEMPNDRLVTYYFKVNTPGVYFIKLRNYHLKKDGDNDVWISVGGGVFGKLYDFEENAWTFDERGTWGTYELQAGKVYKVELAGRSGNFNVDRIHIFRSDKASMEYKPKDGKIIQRFSGNQTWDNASLKESEAVTL